MKVVIFCGGESLRFQNRHIASCKVMVPINKKPLLWHLLNHYSKYNFTDFILCIRDDDNEISSYFSNLKTNWVITILRTGNKSETSRRLELTRDLIDEELFMVTYGDGLSDLNLTALLEFHKNNGKIASLTAIQPQNQYGILKINEHNELICFEEKPKLTEWVNGGFFVFNKEIFNLIKGLNEPLEKNLFSILASNNEMMAFRHTGYWKSVDTYKDYTEIQKDFENGSPL